MRKRWMIGGAVVVVAVVGIVVAHGGRNGTLVPASAAMAANGESKPAEAPLDFTPAEAAKPERLALPQVLEFSGALVSPNTAVVRAKSAGTLLALDVQEGQRVKAGQPIGRIDTADLASHVAERRANLAAVQTTLAQAERQHTSNIGLAEQKFISPIALDASRLQLESARAQVAAAQAAVESANVELRQAALLAPIDGIVAKRFAVAGEKVAPEQQVVSIVDLHLLELSGTVGTQDVARLKPGMPAELRIEGIAEPLHGTLARIAPAAEPGTRAIGVVVQVPNRDEALRAGQYAVAQVTTGTAAPQLTVPVGAISSASGQEYVWTVENHVLMRRTVTTGRRDPVRGRAEVLQGLSPDAFVLGARFDNLREGAKARVVASAAPASAPATAR